MSLVFIGLVAVFLLFYTTPTVNEISVFGHTNNPEMGFRTGNSFVVLGLGALLRDRQESDRAAPSREVVRPDGAEAGPGLAGRYSSPKARHWSALVGPQRLQTVRIEAQQREAAQSSPYFT